MPSQDKSYSFADSLSIFELKQTDDLWTKRITSISHANLGQLRMAVDRGDFDLQELTVMPQPDGNGDLANGALALGSGTWEEFIYRQVHGPEPATGDPQSDMMSKFVDGNEFASVVLEHLLCGDNGKDYDKKLFSNDEISPTVFKKEDIENCFRSKTKTDNTNTSACGEKFFTVLQCREIVTNMIAHDILNLRYDSNDVENTTVYVLSSANEGDVIGIPVLLTSKQTTMNLKSTEVRVTFVLYLTDSVVDKTDHQISFRGELVSLSTITDTTYVSGFPSSN